MNPTNTEQLLIDQLSGPTVDNVNAQDIREVLNRRSDLSTFVVHLTKDKKSLEGIVKHWKIEAKSVWGLAKNKLADNTPEAKSQKCVCFTETPLEYLYLMIKPIKDRQFQPGDYGIAITKKLARKKGLNPVWYVDMTPGQSKQWQLSKALDGLRDEKINNNNFKDSHVAKIAPFIEQMYPGTNNGRPKEFWWEREWRHIGDFVLPNHVILICPEQEFEQFRRLIDEKQNGALRAPCIDPNWGLEKIIARLAGFDNGEIDML